MKNLFDIQKIIIDQFDLGTFYHRHFFENTSLDNAITGILGSRGIGKTTYLLHTVQQMNASHANQALCVSADNPFFLTHSLLDVADYLYKETDTKLLCIDEIHKYPNWEQTLKNMADIYRSIKIVFTGSSMIDIIHSKFDLSRRVTLHYFGGLSFREYLEFHLKVTIAPISFSELLSNHVTFANNINVKQILKNFRDYLQSGYYPFFKELSLEYNKFQAIENISQKTIYEDIALLHNLKTPSLQSIEQIYKFILNSAPGELNTNKLANLVAKSYDQVTEYLLWLEQAGLIHGIYNDKRGKSFRKSPQKLFPENTNLLYAAYLPQTQQDMLGKVRETFFINQIKNAKQKIFYSSIGDFRVNDAVLEIGGRNKADYQVKDEKNAYVVADDILVGDKFTIPLYLFGFLY